MCMYPSTLLLGVVARHLDSYTLCVCASVSCWELLLHTQVLGVCVSSLSPRPSKLHVFNCAWAENIENVEGEGLGSRLHVSMCMCLRECLLEVAQA